MGKSSKKRPAIGLIKGYLPVRVKFPENRVANIKGYEKDETYFYVKEHRDGNSQEGNNKGPCKTLFVANAPTVPRIKSKLLLKTLFGRFGDIERVTLVDNPRRKEEASLTNWASDLKEFFPTFLPPIHAQDKFAHVVFSSHQHMRRTLKSMTEIMGQDAETGNLQGLQLTKLVLQMLRDETERLYREEMGEEDEDDDTDRKKRKGMFAIADRYRLSLRRLDRNKLLAKCNEVMEEYEEKEEDQRLAREQAANQPDEDGFITVTSKSVGVEAGKDELERDPGKKGGRRQQKRNRKKKESIGSTELQDFYRFQRKETRKRNLQDLRKQFDQDLEKVKKMKEDHQYKPF